MKSLFYLILPLILLLSCSGDDNNNQLTPVEPVSLIGTWQVTSTYNDPGDGSGDFEPVMNGKTVVFNENGTWFCNVSICYGSLTQATTSGIYTETELINRDCTVSYTYINGVLEFQHPCFEACLERLTRRTNS